MVNVIRNIFLLSILIFTSCGKNEFLLDFKLDEGVTENYNVTYYAADREGGKTVQAVASVREGKCELQGVTHKPTLLYITQRRSKLPLVILAGRGDKIEVTGEGSDPLEWDIKNNDVNEGLSEWRAANSSILKECIPDSVNFAVKNYVEENPGDPVSTILMLCYYFRKENERGYTELMGMLRGDAKNKAWLEIIARSDQMQHSYSYPAKLENIVLRSYTGGVDTLIINRRDPLLLMFWNTGYSKRKAMIDSIKKLEKDYPDSIRIISDICMDVDSTGWKNAIRKDSLFKDMKRFWVPMGMADSKMMKLKVKYLPYFIVFNKDGVQSYSGGQLSEALKEYRHLMDNSDTILQNKEKAN